MTKNSAASTESPPPAVLHPIEEQKTRLWALTYEKKSKIFCCQNCGVTANIDRLIANPEAVPERRIVAPRQAAEEPTKFIDQRYEVIRVLGQGGMGLVYLVHDKVLDKPMAIKMLRDDVGQAKDTIVSKRFEREAQAAVEMSHVNVVTCYCHGRDKNGALYVVMDYVEGDNLATNLETKGPMEIHQALGIFMQICDALSHAHMKNLIHRDIKPANVVLQPIKSEGYLVKLVDFGIAKTLPLFDMETKNLTRSGEFLGSTAYMSPERCLGEEADERSDLYSLGCLMYETLTGLPPFTDKHLLKALVQQINAQPPSLARKIRISSDLLSQNFDYEKYRLAVEAVIFRCLEKDPDKRYQSADKLRLDLETLNNDMIPKGIIKSKKQSAADSEKQQQQQQQESFAGNEAGAILIMLCSLLIALWVYRLFWL